jgi:hypothetical protein
VPIRLICDVLKGLLPATYVSAWEDVMIGYPFDYKAPDGAVTKVSYGVGNPMGFYSS